jgi:hypothetical protein
MDNANTFVLRFPAGGRGVFNAASCEEAVASAACNFGYQVAELQVEAALTTSVDEGITLCERVASEDREAAMLAELEQMRERED